MLNERASLEHVSDGGLAATHAKRRLPLVAAPTETSEEFNTFRAPLTTIACWRLDDARFGFDASFLLPEAKEDLSALVSLVDKHPEAPLSIFGHADLTGRDDYNKRLSGRRAEAVYAVITRNVAMWESLFKHPHGDDDWGLKQHQQMLHALGFFEQEPSGAPSRESTEAIKGYQRARDLEDDGIPGPLTRAQLFADYMDFLCGASGDEPFTLPPVRFLAQNADPKKKGKGDYQGCSEFNPVVVHSKEAQSELVKPENKLARDNANAPNRRIVVYLFQPGTQVDPARWPCPRSDEGVDACKKRFWSDAKKRRAFAEEKRAFEKDRDTFACRFYHGLAMRSPCEVLHGVRRVQVKLFDPFGNTLGLEPCTFLLAEVEKDAVSDASGVVSVRLPEGEAGVLLPDGRYGVLRVGDSATYDFATRPQVRSGSGDEVVSSPRSESDGSLWPGILGDLDDLAARYDGGRAEVPDDLDLTT